MSHRFQTILFDLDGTLVDSAPDLTQALNVCLGLRDLPTVPLEEVRHMVGRGARKLIEQGLTRAGEPLDEAMISESLKVFLEYYGDHIADHTKPFSGVMEVLEEFKQVGMRMGVCTNKPQALTDELLRLLTIERYFHAVLGADAVRNRKPHAEHVLETIRKAGGAQSSTVMVGDSPTDVEAARAADVPVVAVSFGYSTVPASELGADVLIDDFRDLPRALKELS